MSLIDIANVSIKTVGFTCFENIAKIFFQSFETLTTISSNTKEKTDATPQIQNHTEYAAV